MERPLICPVCGNKGTRPAARCTACGAPFDLDVNGAVAAERIRRNKAIAFMALGAGMVWWLLEILDGPTLKGVVLPAAISFVAFAELTWLSVREKSLRARQQREISSANARLRGAPAEEDVPAPAQEPGPVETEQPGPGLTEEGSDLVSPPEGGPPAGGQPE